MQDYDIVKAKSFLKAASDWHKMSNSSFSLKWDCWSRPALRPYSGNGASKTLPTSFDATLEDANFHKLEFPLEAAGTTRKDK